MQTTMTVSVSLEEKSLYRLLIAPQILATIIIAIASAIVNKTACKTLKVPP